MDKISLKFIKDDSTLEINDNSSYKLLKIEGIDTSELNINSSDNATYDGGVMLSKRITKRPISISVDYQGRDLARKRQELIKFFNLKSEGVLIVEYGEIKRAIKYHIEKFSLPLENIYQGITFNIDLICLEPFFKNINESRVDISNWLGKFTFPLVLKEEGIILGLKEPNLMANIINDGDVDTGLKIVLTANSECNSPRVVNAVTGEYIEVNIDLIAGDKLIINTNQGVKSIKRERNGVETSVLAFLNIESTFLKARVGNNIFTYTARSNPEAISINFYYNLQYLGI